jgi:glycosyltransferase
MKISIITAVFNRKDFISQAVDSVQRQLYADIEYVVVDGASTDGTLQVLKKCLDDRAVLLSESDMGLYHALNKGLNLTTGDVIGIMHSDDFFSDNEVLRDVAAAFSDPMIDVVYGDLDYVAKLDVSRVIRRWRSSCYKSRQLAWGWMPPHPTLFVRRKVIERWGGFDTSFKIAADYDVILRYFKNDCLRAAYIPRVIVKMRVGGESNRSLKAIMIKIMEDYKALRKNGIGGLGALVWKNLSKLPQFFKYK